MGKTVIVSEQTLSGFAYNDLYGAYTIEINPAPFTAVIGETYEVVWDGIAYESVAQDASAIMDGAIALGNASALGLQGNGEPFALGWMYGAVLVCATDAEETHTIAIYQGEDDSEGDSEGDSEDASAVILKDRDGNDISYSGVTSIRLNTADGGTQVFTKGEADEATVELDFSGGDMVVTPDEGKLLTEVNIPKPETLIPANIVKGVVIAGIEGTSEGGGGELDSLLRYFQCHIDTTARTITLYKIFYDLIHADTGSYDVTIPDTINGMSVIIIST